MHDFPDGGLAWLMWMAIWALSLLVCLLALFSRNIRQRKTDGAWVIWANLAAGAVYLASFPAAHLQEQWLLNQNRFYPNLPFEGHSLYIPDPSNLGRTAYGCIGSYSRTSCMFPVTERIYDGTLEFVEMGTNPIRRFDLRVHDKDCYADMPNAEMYEFVSGMISPGLGICVLGRDVDKAEADHILSVEKRRLSFPSKEVYYHAELVRRADGAVINAFDTIGRWSLDADKYPLKGDTADLLDNHNLDRFLYDRAAQDALLEKYGLDQDIMRLAAASPYQSVRAGAVLLGCRNAVQAVLTPETLTSLKRASKNLFSDDPNWQFPDDCRASLR